MKNIRTKEEELELENWKMGQWEGEAYYAGLSLQL